MRAFLHNLTPTVRAVTTIRAVLGGALLLFATRAEAHDLRLPLDDLLQGATRVEKTLRYLRSIPAIPPLPDTPEAQRRVLGAAEIELTLGHRRRALEMLMGRLADPKFQALPEHVETMLFTSQILESMDEAAGAMQYAELALEKGGTPEQMAEAGARWFRLARRDQRLGRRLEIYELWRAKGGEKVSKSDVAAQVAYEVAFALRADGRRADARAMLGRVPSESSVGSRAAYLAGVTFVEEGDLESAERWFSAVMQWPLPDLPADDPRRALERDVRELSALATGRLRYERGDLDAAEEAYALIGEGSKVEPDACWERAFLDLDRKARRGALKHVQCVIDLGASGAHHVDARLFRASLLAHLDRYLDSIEAYQTLHADMVRERDLFARTAAEVDAPAETLFAAMERSAVRRGARATPGPATLFGDAWTAQVDQAYRVERGEAHAKDDLAALEAELADLAAQLARPDAFVVIDVRRAQLERVLRDIQHLLGHAGDLKESAAARHASLSGGTETTTEHAADVEHVTAVIRRLSRAEADVEAELKNLDALETERRARGEKMITEIRAEVAALTAEAHALEREAAGPANAVARSAIEKIKAALSDAAMRAEVGILDTYWLKKEHRSHAIDELLRKKKELEDQAGEALRGEDDVFEDVDGGGEGEARPKMPELDPPPTPSGND